MDSKEFLLRTLERASWKCHNRYNKNVVNSIKRDINRIFVEHEKLHLSPYHSAALIISNLDSAIQHATFDNSHAGNLIEDAKKAFISRSSVFFENNIPLLLKRDLLGNTPLHICIAYKNEVLTNSILNILNTEQFVSLLSSHSGKNGTFTTPIERMLESKWNYLIKYLNLQLSDPDFFRLMEKLNSLEFYSHNTNFMKEPILSIAFKNLSKISTPDYIKFLTRMVENSSFSDYRKLDAIIPYASSKVPNLLHYAVCDPKFNPITEIFLKKLAFPKKLLIPLFFALNADHRTPFHLAVLNKNFEIAFKLLLNSDNAILFLKDRFGRAPFNDLLDFEDSRPVSGTSSKNEKNLVCILNILDSISYKQASMRKDFPTSSRLSSTHHSNCFQHIKKNSVFPLSNFPCQ